MLQKVCVGGWFTLTVSFRTVSSLTGWWNQAQTVQMWRICAMCGRQHTCYSNKEPMSTAQTKETSSLRLCCPLWLDSAEEHCQEADWWMFLAFVRIWSNTFHQCGVQTHTHLCRSTVQIISGGSTTLIITFVTPVILSVWKYENNEMFS